MSRGTPQFHTVRVELGDRGYDVLIGDGILAKAPDLLAERSGSGGLPRGAFALVDENVGPHAARAVGAFEGLGVRTTRFDFRATERTKALDTLRGVLVAMAEARLERSDVVLGIGGGITGDVAGFAAASYRRGVPVVQCPTTLLAMVDASVGGKTGVNLEAAGTLQKNMVGAFHQPALVIADIATLATLPDREFRSGLAECVKHGLLSGATGDAGHLDWLTAKLDAILAREPGALAELIGRSVSFKAAIVAGDEFELAAEDSDRPGRAVLNLGHTFAHAIETLPGLSPTGRPGDAPLLHGEAVALGLVAAAAAGERMGVSPSGLASEVRGILARCGLPGRIGALPATDRLLGMMGADKKVTRGRLRVIVPIEGRSARVVADPDMGALASGWDAIRAG